MSLCHIRRRGTTYHYRRRVPDHLATVLGRREVAVTLRTGVVRDAVMRARHLSALLDGLFETMTEIQTLVPADEAAEIAKLFYADLIDEFETNHITGGPRGPDEIEAKKGLIEEVIDLARQALRANDLDRATNLLPRVRRRLGWEVVSGSNETVAADILGHAHASLSYRLYSEGPAVRSLFEAICKVDYGVDLSHLYCSQVAET